MDKKKLQILELFGGIGSPRVAFRNLGVPVKSIDYVEIDDKAVMSYNAMFADELEYKTQSVVGWNLKPDILIHGSPCQDFSIAGHLKGADKGSGTRSSLMWETVRIIEQLGKWKPKVVIWENVKNVLSRKMKHNFDMYLSYMQMLGYTSNYEILNAMDFGLPQSRQRVFTVSILGGETFNFDLMKRKPMDSIDSYLEFDVPEYYVVTQPSMLNRIFAGNSVFNGRVEVIKDHAMTITCKQMRCPNSGVVKLSNGNYRYLTERECLRLQGYSDKDFDAALSVHPGRRNCLNGILYKQAGNSIPVNIFESMFEVMLPKYFDINLS